MDEHEMKMCRKCGELYDVADIVGFTTHQQGYCATTKLAALVEEHRRTEQQLTAATAALSERDARVARLEGALRAVSSDLLQAEITCGPDSHLVSARRFVADALKGTPVADAGATTCKCSREWADPSRTCPICGKVGSPRPASDEQAAVERVIEAVTRFMDSTHVNPVPLRGANQGELWDEMGDALVAIDAIRAARTPADDGDGGTR